MMLWLLVLLAGAGQAEILVTDTAGRPVQEAVVQVADLASPEQEPLLLSTDAEGHAGPVTAGAGERLLLVSAPGFLSRSETVRFVAEEPHRVVLLRPATLRGRVLSDEKPPAGARIRLRRDPPGEGTPLEAETDGKGLFLVSGIHAGPHRMDVEAEGCIGIVDRGLNVREGQDRRLDLDLPPAAWLEARILGPKGKPLAGVEATVRTKDRDGRFFEEVEKKRAAELEAVSDEKGNLRLGPLSRGMRHRVVFRHDDLPARSVVFLPEEALVRQDVRLPRGGTVRLRIHDGERKPVKAVRALPASDDAADVDLLEDLPVSDKKGTLLLERLPAGTYSLRLQREGFLPRTLRRLRVESGKTLTPEPVELLEGFEIAGTVRDDLDEPVEGAKVTARFFVEGRKLSAETESDGEGAFRLAGLGEGKVSLGVEAEGHLPASEEITLPGAEYQELTLHRAGSIQGMVLDDATDLPVAPYRLTAQPADRKTTRRAWYAAREQIRQDEAGDAEGRFAMEGLLPARYDVTIRGPGYRTHKEKGVEVVAGETVEMEVRLEEGLTLEGTVLDDETGMPVACAQVGRSQWQGEVPTDTAGRFRLEGLDGPTTIYVLHPQYVLAQVMNADPEATVGLEIRLRKGGAIQGTVYGPGRSPLPGAQIHAYAGQGGGSATTDASGRYRIDGMPPGWVPVIKEDVPGTYQGYRRVMAEVRAGEVTTVDFGAGTRFWGVIAHEGSPASGVRLSLAEVILKMPEGGFGAMETGALAARTGEEGGYEILGVPPGTYGVTLDWQGRYVGKQVTVGLEEEHRFDFEIRDLWVEGRVEDEETRSPLQANVSANPRGPGREPEGLPYMSIARSWEGEELQLRSHPFPSVTTGSDGRFRLLVPEPGTYHLWAAGARGFRMPEEEMLLEVVDSVRDIVIGMVPGIEVVIKAVDAATGGEIQSGCGFISGEKRGSRRDWYGPGDAAGSIEGQRPGPALVGALAPGYAVSYRMTELSELRHEFTIPLAPGGTLRILLPEGVPPKPGALLNARLSIRDGQGKDLRSMLGLCTRGDEWFEMTADAEIRIPHLPLGPLTVSIGGGDTGLASKQATVTIEAGGETVADLR